MIEVVVSGYKGRMGQRIVRLIKDADDMDFAAGIEAGDSLDDVIEKAHVVVDFSTPDASAEHAQAAARSEKPIVIGTTGLKASHEKAIKKASQSIPIVYSPNMGIGVNLMFKLIEVAGEILSDRCDVDIVETHHAKKVDRPSGTAKKMAERAATRREGAPEISLFNEAMAKRKAGDRTIRICSIREGDVVGDHEIKFRCAEETLTIFHRAHSRDLFARGALSAARWVIDRPPGLYGMADVLGIR